jgi:prevent-host-death family protein
MYITELVLYTQGMAEISVSEARATLPDVIEQARTEAVHLTRHGRPQAVLVSPEQYERLLDALEDQEDALAFDTALAEEGENIPWEQVKADLGWA